MCNLDGLLDLLPTHKHDRALSRFRSTKEIEIDFGHLLLIFFYRESLRLKKRLKLKCSRAGIVFLAAVKMQNHAPFQSNKAFEVSL